MFLLSDRWVVIPEMLYIGLLFLFVFLVVISIVAIVMGAMKKKKMKWFILWGVVVLVSAIYLVATFGLGWIVANTMLGG